MGRNNEDKSILSSCMGKSQELVSLVEYATDSIVSKTIIDKPLGNITLFAFDKGQGLSEHSSPYDAVVEVIEGSAKLSIGGKETNVCAGQIIIMPANVSHSVNAEKKFKMLLTMIHA